MEETISLKEIFEVIKKRLLLIVSLIVGAALISAIISYFVLTPTYQSSTQFIVNQSEQDPAAQYDVNNIRTNVELINTYNVIIKSPAILEDVINELDLSLTTEELQDKIEVASAENSQVVTVTATDPDANLAAQMANKTVEIFQEQIPDIMNVDNVKILSEAEVKADPTPVSPKPMLNIAIAIVLGGMVGVGLAFLLEYLDNTIKTEDDIDKKLNVPVLGVISHIDDKDVRGDSYQPAAKRAKRGDFRGTQKKSI
ncbi:YveK family protein [Lentibacillus sp. Marseille-P4043]|uniref:YveK family protein n=1 Tax=Lentibacillus sp. Marseille-P4043 TaxID=2040293 RepID=UPI000D0B19D7|nr:Wzz/FepE/Etk N-terminal domain-containing protein [Lentibacillus sp. Marseille-P4043]